MFDSLIYVARALTYLLGRFVKQVLGATYARLVDARYTRWNWSIPQRLAFLFCIAHGEHWPSLTFRLLCTLLQFAKFIISLHVALKTAYIYRMAFYAGIVKQFFVDYLLRNHMLVYPDDRIVVVHSKPLVRI